MKEWPSVSVVILNWNGRSFLQQFLPSVLATDYPNLSIVVADNASSDDSVDFVKANFPSIKILEIPENLGYAKGYNWALEKLDSKYFILLNSDVVVTPNWIKPLMGLMEKDASIAACQPKMLAFHAKDTFEYAGACGGWIDYLGYPFSRGRVFDFCEKDSGQYDQAVPVFWASGAALCVRADAFKKMNGFDEYFFAHQEEIDLCWRMQRAGWRIFVQPESVVYHVGGGTLPMGSERKVFLNFRNNLIMLSKNLPFSEAIYKLPLRIFLDWLAALQAVLKKDWRTAKAIFKAHIAFVGWKIKPRKKQDLPKIKMQRLCGVVDKSIVWQFFIRKRKTFLEIVANNSDF